MSAAGRQPLLASAVAWLEARLNLTEIASLLTCLGLLPAELDTRKPLGAAWREAVDRPMPSYARWPRVLGILSLLVFACLAVTGVMLAFYYQPTPAEAHESVTTIVRDVTFGWFVHQIHGWAAGTLLLILLLRAWRFYFQGLYKAPREVLWVLAILTFLVATHCDLTGRLLAWDEGGYWTTVRALEILYTLPALGPMLAFLVGGHDMDSLVLVRFYLLHVVILPAILLGLFYLSFSSVRRVGLSEPEGAKGLAGPAAHRVYMLNVLILAILIFGILVTLATLAPAPFDRAADPFSTPAGARPPWYLLAAHGFIESLPSFMPRWSRALIVEGLLAACLLLPFLDRSPSRAFRERRLAVALGVVVLLIWSIATWHGYRLEVPP